MSLVLNTLVTKQKKQAQEKDKHCTPTCVSVKVAVGIKPKCPGMIGSINTETNTMCLANCLCSCHDEHSEALNEEQEQWFKVGMAASTRRDLPNCLPIGLKWIETERS